MPSTEADSRLDGTTIEAVAPRPSSFASSSTYLAVTVLGHADPARIGDRALLGEMSSLRPALLSRLQPYFGPPRADGPGAPLGDRHLSREPLRIERCAAGLAVVADQIPHCLRLDGRQVSGRAEIEKHRLRLGVVLEIGDRVALLLHCVGRTGVGASGHGLIGASDAIERLRERISEAAPTPWPLLVRGETGTGKELVARAVHRASGRRGPLLAVNMAALPSGLAAAELFGARRGAFTNATSDRPGLFTAAEGGSLFLDEIGDASEELQTLLLRCLETGEVLPIGSNRSIQIDVRWIAATDSRLEEEAAAGRFRLALLHRLAGIALDVPPLRERRDDIPRLLLHFLRHELELLGKELPKARPEQPFLPTELARLLTLYSWPGNVRELRNFARNCAVEWRGGPLTASLLPPAISAPHDRAEEEESQGKRKPNEVDREEALQALEDNGYEIKATAAALGVTRTSLYALLERFGLNSGAGKLAPEAIAAALQGAAGNEAAAARELGVSARALRRRRAEIAALGSRHGR